MWTDCKTGREEAALSATLQKCNHCGEGVILTEYIPSDDELRYFCSRCGRALGTLK